MGDLSKMFKGACAGSSAGKSPFERIRDNAFSIDIFSTNPVQAVTTMLSALTGGVNFSVSVQAVQTVSAGAGAASVAKQTIQNCNVGLQQVTDMKQNMCMVIQTAQDQVRQAASECGINAGWLFPKMASATADVATGLAGSCLGDLCTVLDVATDIKNNSGGMSKEEAYAKIEAHLRSQSPPARPNGVETIEAQNQSLLAGQFNWNNYFDAGHTVEELMELDPQNPHQLREYQQLCTQEAKLKEELANAQAIQAKTESDLTIDVDNTCASLSSISSCVLENAALFVDEIKDFITPKDATPELLAKRNAPAAPGGMTA